MSNPTHENAVTVDVEIETSPSTEPAPRPRLTVEVPTQITAGLPKDCFHCFCSKTYCCS